MTLMERVLFIGTPEFAVPSLMALLNSCHVVGVVTQRDRPAGRGRRLSVSPVKQLALQHEICVLQPISVSSPEVLQQIAALAPDVIVVVAFGQILRQDLLELPPYGCLNVHASLLPRWRGAAPVASAILAGDPVSGVTVMKLDAGLDTGPILAQRKVPILADDTKFLLEDKLACLGASLLIDTLPGYLAGEITPCPQREFGVTIARRLRKEDGLLDWSQPAVELERKVRAFHPWPGVYTLLHGVQLKVLRASVVSCSGVDAPPGTLVLLEGGVAVITGKDALYLKEVQLAGKRRMDIAAFLCGQKNCVGSRLGTVD